MKLHLLVLVTGALLAASNSQASTKSVSEFVQTSVRFSGCSPTEESDLSAAALEGLTRISEINPELVENRLAYFGDRTVTVDCSATATGQFAVADTTSKQLKTFLGMGFVSRMKNVNMRIGRILKQAPALRSTSIEIVFLHEQLHTLQFDNLPVLFHNNPDSLYKLELVGPAVEGASRSLLAGFMLDVVYACSFAAFPNQAYASTSFKMASMSIDPSIATCREARVVGKKVRLNTLKLPMFTDGINASDVSCLIEKSSRADITPGMHYKSWTPELRRKCVKKN